MRDVAELAGVFTAAVSRYLNGGYISEEEHDCQMLLADTALDEAIWAPR